MAFQDYHLIPVFKLCQAVETTRLEHGGGEEIFNVVKCIEIRKNTNDKALSWTDRDQEEH